MNITSRDTFGSNTMPRHGNTTLPNGFTPQNGTASPSSASAYKAEPEKRETVDQAKPATDTKKTPKATQSKPFQTPPAQKAKSPISGVQIRSVLAFCQTYRREIGAALLALSGVLLLLALVSYDPADRSNAHVSLSPEQAQTVATPRNANARALTPAPATQGEYIVQNWLGYVGATVAHFVYNYTVGYSALLFPALMFFWTFAIIREKITDRLLLATSLAFVGAALVASFAGVLQLVQWMPPMRPEWSGSVGQFIARMLWQIIGTVGAFIVLTLGLIATLFVALDLNIEKSITRFKAEKARLSAFKTKTQTNIGDAVRAEQAFTQEQPPASNDAASMAAMFTDDVLSAKDYDDYHVEMPPSFATERATTEQPATEPQSSQKAIAIAADDEILSVSASTNGRTSFADAEEPARFMRRTAQSPDMTSLRRDLISKYSEDEAHALHADSAQEQASVLSVPAVMGIPAAMPVPVRTAASSEPAPMTLPAASSLSPSSLSASSLSASLVEKRVNNGTGNSPTISVSTPQTTVFTNGFSYPAQASITFVETPKEEFSKKNDELDEPSSRTALETNADAQKIPQAAQNRGFSEEERTAHQRNTEHLAGLVAGQVAEEIAQSIATQVATEVAGRIVSEAMEKAAEKVAEQKIEEQKIEEQKIAEQKADSEQWLQASALQSSPSSLLQASSDDIQRDVVTFNNKVADVEDFPLHITPLVAPVLDVPIMIRSGSNAQNVIPKPMFMPLNDEILREEIRYEPPTLELLVPQEISDDVSEEELQNNARILQEKLKTFRIEIENLQVTPGPVVTQYEFVPASGVKVSQIENLSDDMALALKARGIRIIAPVPGRGTVAVEIPNAHATAVRFSSIVDSAEFEDSQLRLPLALGKTIHGDVFTADLAKMPHLLIAGATGSGKSVGINSIIASLLYKMHPRNLKFVIIDPKRVEMTQYRALANHFLAVCPDIDEKIITDPQNAVIALKSVVAEMTRRYEVLQKVGQRNIVDYNQKIREGKYKDTSDYLHHEMPYIVVIIDELADLMMTASRDVEEPICRLAQLARAVGIHLVVATQRPSVDVVTGLIKANFPARIAYQVASKIDSRTILDASGAEHLLGNGDMLFTPGGAGKPMRLQNSYLSTDEVERICEHIASQEGYSQPYMLPSVSEKSQRGGASGTDDDRDAMFEEAARLVVRHQQCSTSLLQRRMKIGYGRAARIVDQLEEAGIIGAMDGGRGRSILVDSEAALGAIL
jgi:DNA segregation ATPase FtsK/SpoIIIE-like protein